MNKKIKHGIIGAGYLGSYHAEQIKKFKLLLGKFLSPFILLKDSSFRKQLTSLLFVKKTDDSW